MKPFDLPPHNPLDWLRADLCRPAETRQRETYPAKAPDKDEHDHPHLVEKSRQPVLPIPPELYVPAISQQMVALPHWSAERERQAASFAVVETAQAFHRRPAWAPE